MFFLLLCLVSLIVFIKYVRNWINYLITQLIILCWLLFFICTAKQSSFLYYIEQIYWHNHKQYLLGFINNQAVKCTVCFLNWFLMKQEAHWVEQLKFATWFLKCFFKVRQFICYFVLYLSLKKAWTFIWTYLNSLNPEMLCAKFSLGYWLLRRIFFYFVSMFCYCVVVGTFV